MKIRNESQRTYFFNGGYVAPNHVVDIQDRRVAEALIKGYPGELICLDTLEAEVIPAQSHKVETEELTVKTRKPRSKKNK